VNDRITQVGIVEFGKELPHALEAKKRPLPDLSRTLPLRRRRPLDEGIGAGDRLLIAAKDARGFMIRRREHPRETQDRIHPTRQTGTRDTQAITGAIVLRPRRFQGG
jgi:hypothetical protein